MSGNIISINGAIEYYVGDSEMDRVIRLLDDVGFKTEPSDEVTKYPVYSVPKTTAGFVPEVIMQDFSLDGNTFVTKGRVKVFNDTIVQIEKGELVRLASVEASERAEK